MAPPAMSNEIGPSALALGYHMPPFGLKGRRPK